MRLERRRAAHQRIHREDGPQVLTGADVERSLRPRDLLRRVLIIGVGNEYRGDDGVGLFVARRLKARRLPNTEIVEADGDGAALIEAWGGARTVILCDAVSSGEAPGSIHRFGARSTPIPINFFHHSTHAFGVAEAVALARALGRLPPRLIVYGIEGETVEAGIGLSPAVEKAAVRLVELLLAEIG